MKILVCISKTPDTTAKGAFTDNNTKFDTTGVQWIVNPWDEWFALVRAIELKEADPTVTVHLLTVGEADADPIIRKALALGGDEAIRINASPTESQFVAHQIAAIVKDGNYDLVLTGKETIDHNGSSVGGLVAGETALPFISLATKLVRQGSTLTITREIEGGQESCEVEIPVVVSAQKGMAEARIPNMRGIMAARTKPLKVVEPVDTTEYTATLQFELPAPKSGVKLIAPDQVQELVRLLHEEAKVI